MKNLTAEQEAARVGRTHGLWRFLEFDWPGGETWYSERRCGDSFSPDPSKDFAALIAEFPSVSAQMDLALRPDLGGAGSGRFALYVDPDAGRAVDVRAEEENPIGSLVTAWEMLEMDPAEAGEAHWSRLARYRIERFWVDYDRPDPVVFFEGASVLMGRADVEVGRGITKADFPAAPERSLGRMIPMVFGEVEGASCPLATEGWHGELAADISDSATTIALATLDGLTTSPAPTVVIGREKILAGGVDAATRSLTGCSRGAGGTEASAHPAGRAVYEVLDRYRFLIADHAVTAVSNIKVNGVLASASHFADPSPYYKTVMVDGRVATVVDLAEIPSYALPNSAGTALVSVPITDARAAMTADVTGLVGASGSWLTGGELVELLLTGSDWLGLDGTDYVGLNDAASAAEATLGEVSAGSVWRLDRWLGARTTLRELLSEVISESGIRVVEDGGRLVFTPSLRVGDESPTRSVATEVMASGVVLRGSGFHEVVNRLTASYRRSPSVGGEFSGSVEVEDGISQSYVWGLRPATARFEWVRDDDVAQALATRFVEDFSRTRRLARVETYAGRTLDFEAGDVVALTDLTARLAGRSARIVAASRDRADRMVLTLAMTDRCLRVWEDSASGSYVDVCTEARKMLFAVGGVLCAVLSEEGLRLRGRLVESPLSGVPLPGDLLSFDGGSNALVIRVPVAGGVDSSAQLTSDGDLHAARAIWNPSSESPAYPGDTTHVFTEYIEYGSARDGTLLTADGRRVFMELEGGLGGPSLRVRQVFETGLQAG